MADMRVERLIAAYDQNDNLIVGRGCDRANEGRMVIAVLRSAKRRHEEGQRVVRIEVIDTTTCSSRGYLRYIMSFRPSAASIRDWYGL